MPVETLYKGHFRVCSRAIPIKKSDSRSIHLSKTMKVILYIVVFTLGLQCHPQDLGRQLRSLKGGSSLGYRDQFLSVLR